MTQLRSTRITSMLALAALVGCSSQAPGGAGAGTKTTALGVTLGDILYLVGVPSGRCMSVIGGSTADQAALELRDCSGATSQQLRLETADGHYVLRVVGSDRCVEVSGASTSAGASIVQATCDGGTSQQWSGTDVGSGAYRITSRASGMTLDAYGAGTANGTQIVQWPENGGANQQWRVVAASDVKNHTVTIATSGSGTTSPAAGSYTVLAGTTGAVTATPASGHTFTGWSGSATGTTNPLTVTVNGDLTLTANFAPAAASYTLNIATSGGGTTSPAAGSYGYPAGTSVTVTATPASGSTFSGWSGAATGTANPVTIAMDGNKALTATFSASGSHHPCAVPSFIDTDVQPVGWASQAGGTTGGGSATPTLVKTLAEFNAAAKGTTPAVIYVQGALEQGSATIGSNKTVIGCSGGASLRGHVDVKAASDVIIRNLAIVGYNCAPPDVDPAGGGECQNGQDAVTVQKSSHVWFDHDAISDGSDGNLDINHGSDYITISYTRFFYSSARTDPNDTGAAGHRYSNLIGHSDSNASEDAGHLRITFHHDWWGDHVMERQPRVRFGQVHLFNSLWTCAGNNYAIGVGVGANILDEGNAFIQVRTPVNTRSFVDASIAPSYVRSVDNLYSGTTGDAVVDLGPGSVFTPPYAYSAGPASGVEADVRANAGPR